MSPSSRADSILRVRLLLLAILVFLGFLAAFLWRIQVARGQFYSEGLEKQSIRRVRLAALRGRILDRNGLALADNRPSHCLAIYLEELRQPGSWDRTIDHVQEILENLGDTLGLETQLTRKDIWNHIRRRLPLPLLAWKDLDDTALARWAEQAASTPGIDIYTESVRVYPYGETACHALGYVGRADIQNRVDEPFHYYLPEMAGRAGLEAAEDDTLRGESGGELVRVDVTGYRRQDPHLAKLRREPVEGRDVQLTLDVRLQKILEEAMGELQGAAVAVDPRNGDVLAIASRPGFDPNEFYPGISSARWRALMEDSGKPLFNRSVAGAYAPGSTFKPVVALAALENEQVLPSVQYTCPGSFQLGGFTWNCAHRRAHGTIGLQYALAVSCNVYFYKMGNQIGYDYIYHMAEALGFGSPSGLGLEHESAGLLPNDRWMRETFGHGWRGGDTINASIGQGALSVTPIQMAMYTAALANGGTLYQPRLVLARIEEDGKSFEKIDPIVRTRLHWHPSFIGLVRKGMRDVVMSDFGTGRIAAVPGLSMAAKTGTAEYGRKEERKYRGWMIAFAPFDDPEIAIAVVVDDAQSGGSAAGPVIRDFMEQAFPEGRRHG